MAEVRDKIYTYIGFAIRSGKIRIGVNAIQTLKGNIPLLLLCNTASNNTVKDAQKLAKKFNSKIVLSKVDKLEDIFYKENCKVVAILDQSLATAILDNINEKFAQFGG